MITVDLEGPGGNAFSIMGVVKKVARATNKTQEETENIIQQMTSGDYENLLSVVEENFPDQIEFI